MGASGTTTVDFGAFPGKSDTSVEVTGQAGIVAGSLVEAWIRPVATADHSADEHMLEPLRIVAGNIVAATGFTIYGFNVNALNEPTTPPRAARFGGTGQDAGPGQADRQAIDQGGLGTRLFGLFTVAWVWN